MNNCTFKLGLCRSTMPPTMIPLVTTPLMINNETSLPQESTTKKLSVSTQYILIGSLAGTILILACILVIIFWRRKRQTVLFKSTLVESASAAHSHISVDGDVEQDAGPPPRPPIDIPNIPAVYTDTNENSSKPNISGLQTQISFDERVTSGYYAEVDIPGVLPPPRLSTISHNSDYENAAGIVYENYSRSSLTAQSPTSPGTAGSAGKPPVLPKRPADQDGKTGNLFRKGTKAHNVYSNALQDYEIPIKYITTNNQIGKGNFSTVYSGIAARLPYTEETKKTVAIKTMKKTASDSDRQEFLYEFEIMKLTNTLNHDNITKLLGSVTHTQPCMIILELMPNGNLRKFLRGTRSSDVYYNLHGNSCSLSERQLLQFALDIANGMEGIADLQLLHRDLAARNILLDSNLRCKISDFGFAKDILNKPEYKSKSVLHRARPVRWLAPESVLLFKHSILSDVWSYGIVLWEILTLGNLPYPDMKVTEVQQALAKGYRMSCPTHCSPDLYRVMACCWEEDPKMRPPFHQLVDKMRQLLDQANRMIDMDKIEEDDYIDVLPPDEQELFLELPQHDSLC